jgi:hypothetical protein
MNLSDELEKILFKFYDSYRYQLESSGKLKSGSLLIACLKMKKNDRFRPLMASAIESHKIPIELLTQLKERNLIRCGDDISRFVITGKGIWLAERLKNILDEDTLIEFIDTNYFGQLFEDAKPLTDKEKVILLSMISARAFSEESSVDMKRNSDVNAAWLEVFKTCSNKLRVLKAIEATDEELFPEDVMYEDPASHFIRHSDQLPRKTKAIYMSSKKRDNKYFLQISKDGKIDADKLAYLIWLVLNDHLDPDNVEDFYAFCTSIAYDYCVRLFEHGKHVFASPHYDEILRNAIIDSIIHRQKWEATQS